MEAVAKAPIAETPVELSIAGWFALAAAVVELCLGRLASLLGLYLGVGAGGPLAWLANAGELAMYAAGFTSLALALLVLSSMIGDPRNPGGWWRAIVILVSPVYLLVAGLAAFAPALSSWLLLAAYVAAILTATVLAAAAIARPIGGGARRVLIALAVGNLLQAFGWAALDYFEADRATTVGTLAIRAYLVAEVIWVVAPALALLGLLVGSPRRLGELLRRPHLPALGAGLAVAAAAAGIVVFASGKGAYLTQIAYLSLGLTLSVPGAPWIYVVSAFLAAVTAVGLIVPTRRHPVDARSRQLGFGLTLVWLAGLQPYRVFQFAMMLLGFALLCRGALAGAAARREPEPGGGLAELMRELDAPPPPKGAEHGSAAEH